MCCGWALRTSSSRLDSGVECRCCFQGAWPSQSPNTFCFQSATSELTHLKFGPCSNRSSSASIPSSQLASYSPFLCCRFLPRLSLAQRAFTSKGRHHDSTSISSTRALGRCPRGRRQGLQTCCFGASTQEERGRENCDPARAFSSTAKRKITHISFGITGCTTVSR